MENFDKTILVCPKNDEESLQILKISAAFGISTLISDQPHGAKLEREEKLLERLKSTNPDATKIVIVEIPGPEVEDTLKSDGYEVIIIDHHRYDDLDRTHDTSSLEQFLVTFSLDDAKLIEFGFDPVMVRGVAAIDRGFLWELKREPITKEQQEQVMDYYREFTMELGPERRAREEAVAREAWEGRREQDGLLIVESEVGDVGFRDALSYLVAKSFDEPRPVLIRQGNRRIYVQDTDAAGRLHERFGGFLFGQEKCWGVLVEGGQVLPVVDEVINTVLES